MRERRLAAYDVYDRLPIPKTPNEDTWRRTTDMHVQDYWRRTDLRRFKLDRYHPISLSPSESAEHAPLPDGLANRLASLNGEPGQIVQQDGIVRNVALAEDLERKDIYFADMNTALKERPELVESYFMTKAVPVDWNKFDALHGAFWQGGYLLHVPQGAILEVPLRVFVALSEAGRTDLSHTLIIADEGSQVTVLEEQLSTDADTPGLHCGAVENSCRRQCPCELRRGTKVESPDLEFFDTTGDYRERRTVALGIECFRESCEQTQSVIGVGAAGKSRRDARINLYARPSAPRYSHISRPSSTSHNKRSALSHCPQGSLTECMGGYDSCSPRWSTYRRLSKER